MHIELIIFYNFSSLAFISAFMVINLTNAVHSVLFLILVFCNVAGLLLLLLSGILHRKNYMFFWASSCLCKHIVKDIFELIL